MNLGDTPTPGLDGSDDSLAAGMDVDMLDGDLLLAALAAMPVQGLKQRDIGAGKLIRLVQVLLAPRGGLFGDHSPSEALHGRQIGRDELTGEHSFEFVSRGDPAKGNGD